MIPSRATVSAERAPERSSPRGAGASRSVWCSWRRRRHGDRRQGPARPAPVRGGRTTRTRRRGASRPAAARGGRPRPRAGSPCHGIGSGSTSRSCRSDSSALDVDRGEVGRGLVLEAAQPVGPVHGCVRRVHVVMSGPRVTSGVRCPVWNPRKIRAPILRGSARLAHGLPGGARGCPVEDRPIGPNAQRLGQVRRDSSASRR
jgi:hypothetical protein